MLFAQTQWTLMCFLLHITAVIGLQSRICALKSSSVDLPCSAQHATSNISWYTVHTKGSNNVLTELSADGNNGTYSMAKDNNFTLTIKVLRERDAKSYCCKESTENPQSCLNNQTELHVSELQVKVIPATEGQTVTLMCSSSCPLTEKPAAYIWYKNREFLYEDWSPWYQELLSSEEAVTYSCAVKGYEDLRAPEVSVDSVTKTCFSVTYTESSMCSQKLKSKDQFCSITYPTDLHVQMTLVRSFVILTCNTSCPVADAHTAYKWYWNRKLYSDCERQDITIFKPKADIFSCAVKSNEDVLSHESCINNTKCMAVNYVSRRICALEGSSVNITSQYLSHSVYKYKSWYKVKLGGEEDDCEVFEEATGRVKYYDSMKNEHTLRINDVKRNDSAEYSFRLANYIDHCNLPGVMLVVTGVKVTVTPSAVVTEGQRVTLTCSTSCPLTDNTNYIWYLNSQPVGHQTKHLILDPVSRENEGNYSCAVNSPQNISSAEKALTVKALEKTVAGLNILKITLFSLIPAVVFLLYMKTRKKKTVTATAEQSDREQPGQGDQLYECVELNPAAQ
ncbi:ethanolamine kinase [Sarotherodon galilaeus]